MAEIENAKTESADIKHSVGQNLKGMVFDEVNLDGAVFHNSNLYCVAVIGSEFSECRIEQCAVQNAQFRNVGMRHMSFQAADLCGAIFTDVNLLGSTINHAGMQESHFANMNLGGSQYDNCIMDGAEFKNCEWGDAKIDGIPVRDLLSAYMEVHNT